MSKKNPNAAPPKQTPPEWLIESDVPIPPRARGHRSSKYPWDQLAAPKGDKKESFTFTADDPVKTAKQFCSTCYSAGRRLGRKFTCRAERDENGELTGLVRVWRTA